LIAMARARRPTFLDFSRIRFPVGALASIGHRISGVILAASLPVAAAALQASLESEARFESLVQTARSPLGRVALVLLAWACAHHLFAGIRHLLTDIGIGASLPVARRSAYAALIGGGAVALYALLA
jgi:succinate dehydrogenase / fumarate reductase cytochrome b subunit